MTEVAMPQQTAYATTQMEELREFLSLLSSANILRMVLGFTHPESPPLAQHVIINCIDCESLEFNHDLMTEIELACFDSQSVRPFAGAHGPHAESILNKVHFYHLRMIEHAHRVNRLHCKGKPENNRFGSTRFLTSDEAMNMLTELFTWLIDPNRPELGHCPIIFLGHAIRNESEMLDVSIGFNPQSFSNVVATNDTQAIADEVNIRDRDPRISLPILYKHVGFEYCDGHTAVNDAAYTLFAAMLMVMHGFLPEPPTKSTQQVVNEIEQGSKESDCYYVILKYCTRCGSRKHLRTTCHVKVFCETCRAAGRLNAATTHRTHLCARGPSPIT